MWPLALPTQSCWMRTIKRFPSIRPAGRARSRRTATTLFGVRTHTTRHFHISFVIHFNISTVQQPPDLRKVTFTPSPLHNALHLLTLAKECIIWYNANDGACDVQVAVDRHRHFSTLISAVFAEDETRKVIARRLSVEWNAKMNISSDAQPQSRKHEPNLKCSSAKEWLVACGFVSAGAGPLTYPSVQLSPARAVPFRQDRH